MEPLGTNDVEHYNHLRDPNGRSPMDIKSVPNPSPPKEVPGGTEWTRNPKQPPRYEELNR